MYPEELFNLQGADVGSQWLNVTSRQVTASGAAATQTGLITIPDNEVWLIDNIMAEALAGAAQTTAGITVFIRRVANIIELFKKFGITTQFDAIDRQWSGMAIRGGVSIGAFSQFSAGVASNSVTLHVQAIAIPRGNFVQT